MATSSPAHPRPSSPAASTPGSRTLSTATADHVARTVEALQRVAAGTLATFAEPRLRDLTRAHRLRVRFAETVIGFALGQTARQLVEGIRRRFGADVAREVRARLEHALPSAVQGHGDPLATLRRIDPADECLVTVALREELRTRLGQLAPHLTAVVEAAQATLARLAPRRADELAAVLDLLAGDRLPGDRLAEELILGWPVLVALLGDEHAAITTASPMWTAWVPLARGQRAPEALTPHDFIMVVR